MSFFISTRAELIKSKRSASFWICVLGSGFIPLIFLLTYTLAPEKNYPRLQLFPWAQHFGQGWQALSHFLLPMFIILICITTIIGKYFLFQIFDDTYNDIVSIPVIQFIYGIICRHSQSYYFSICFFKKTS